VEEFADLFVPPAKAAYERALGRCKSEHRLGEMKYMLELEAQMQLLGSIWNPDMFKDMWSCAQFRLMLESTITQEGKGEATTNTQLLFIRGEVEDLSLIDLERLAGVEDSITDSGKLNYATAEGRSELQGISGSCVANTIGGQGSEMEAILLNVQQRPRKYGPWSVPEIYGEVPMPEDPQPGKTTVAFDPGDPREKGSGDCLGMESGDTTDLWDQIFWLRHFKEEMSAVDWSLFFGNGSMSDEQPPIDTGFIFDLELMNPPGRIYAAYEIPEENRCDVFDDGLGSGKNCERTFITLYHEPSN
jgi:hypothetical protein